MGYALLVDGADGVVPLGPARPRRSSDQAGCQAGRQVGGGDVRRSAGRGGRRGRAMSTVLAVRDLKKSFGGIVAVDGVSFDVNGGRNSRHHRPERQRQVDLVQLHPRTAAAERGRCASRRPFSDGHAAVRSQSAGSEPHVSAAADFPAIDRAREPDPGGPGAQGQHALPPHRPAAMPGFPQPADRMLGFLQARSSRRRAGGRLELRPAEAARRRDGVHGGTSPRLARRAGRRRQPDDARRACASG